MDRPARNFIFAVVVAICQTFLFFVLHHFLIYVAVAMGQPSYVKGGVGWGITVNYSHFVFAPICLISGFLSATFLPKYLIHFPLLGFLIFSWLFVGNHFYLRSFAYPKRALLLLSSAFIALVMPYLIFQAATSFGWMRRQRWLSI